MRIVLNLLHALPEIGGGWNYIQNLVAALAEYDRSNFYVAFATKSSECLVPLKPNFEKVLIRVHSKSRPQRILYENTMLQYQSKRYGLDCMHWFASTHGLVNAAPAVVTVYDLQPFLAYASFPVIKRAYLQWMMARTAERASVLLPMSYATANDLRDKLGADPANMIIIPAIIPDQLQPVAAKQIARVRQRHHLPDFFWLYVAHTYTHKNHVRLLQAYHQMKVNGEHPWPLVFRGDPKDADGQIRRVISRLGLVKDVIWLPQLEQSELVALYSAASALVFPSIYEGGGIPVLEAMACGCPVVAADIPPVKEFAGDTALYFNPLDVVSISEAMLEYQRNVSERAQSREQGLRRVAQFRPQPVVHRLLAAYAIAAQG